MRVELAWVDALLSRWGRWAIRCESGALGFASSSILAGGLNGDSFDACLPRGVGDDDNEVVDGAVRKLPACLRETVIQVYQFGQGKSDRDHAATLGISRQALSDYIVRAHRQIALDISLEPYHNHVQSANRGSCLDRKQPATA